jgi:hypothetical protein
VAAERRRAHSALVVEVSQVRLGFAIRTATQRRKDADAEGVGVSFCRDGEVYRSSGCIIRSVAQNKPRPDKKLNLKTAGAVELIQLLSAAAIRNNSPTFRSERPRRRRQALLSSDGATAPLVSSRKI